MDPSGVWKIASSCESRSENYLVRINHVNRRKSARTDNLKIRGDGLDGKSAGIVLKCIYQILGD